MTPQTARSDRQHAGLALGPQARWMREDLAHRIAAGTVDLPALLDGAGDAAVELAAGRMSVARLVREVPGLVAPVANSLLGAAGIGGTTDLRDTTIAARRALAAMIRLEVDRGAAEFRLVDTEG